MSAKNPPVLKSVKEIIDENEKFYVAAYQRGYRWTVSEVKQLIEDILLYEKEESSKSIKERCPFYSLQAVVVKKNGDCFEVIDGQQRLTTTLIILHAFFVKQCLNMDMINSKNCDCLKPKTNYFIQYETRENSDIWLKQVTKAFLIDYENGNEKERNLLKEKNSDYHHFVDAFTCALDEFDKLSESEFSAFNGVLQDKVYVIWYDVSEDESSKEVDVFDRINATKIELNNAELIKALFLQSSVFVDHPFERNQMAVEWDDLEKRLQNQSFWCFIYSKKNSAYSYETHIEYLFDLIKKKQNTDKDNYYFTFNSYYTEFLKADNKFLYVKQAWEEIQEMYSLLEEWYSNKECYHYIGYLIEYGIDENSNKISIPYLKDLLKGIPKTAIHEKLVELVRLSLKNIKSEQLFHTKPELTQVLFLFNIETEQQRKNAEARFSFSGYKSLSWNQEHVASHVDYKAKLEERFDLALDLLEYFTGIREDKSKFQNKSPSETQKNIESYSQKIMDNLPEESKEQNLCKEILKLFDSKMTDSNLESTFEIIMSYFDSSKPFNETILYKKGKTISEKDFIWNFVLLNEHTNKSYGNHIFPVKRKRILNDEFGVYTPITTRFVFEKSYSKKLTEMIKWGRDDAIAYWNEICKTLKNFLPEGFALPSYIKI